VCSQAIVLAAISLNVPKKEEILYQQDIMVSKF